MRNNLGSSLFNSWVATRSQQRIYEFDDFRLDAGHLILSRKEREISLPPRAVETLLALIERPGEVVSKDELLDTVWPDTIVDESNLFAYLSHLRKALGNKKDGKPYVETLRRRGYRFVGEVRIVTETKPEIPIKAVHPATEQSGRRSSSRISANGGNVIELTEWLDDAPHSAQPNAEKDAGEIVGLPPLAARMPDRRPLVIVTVLGILIFGSLGLYLWKVNSQSAPIPVKTIAVLPFGPLVAGSGNEYLEYGMADELIRNLNSSGEINARPLSSVRKFTGDDRDAAIIGRQLGVDYVVDGHLQILDGRIRVSVQLISSEDGRQAWAGPFDEKFTNILDLQVAIADKIATVLRPQLTKSAKARLAKRGTKNPEAYQLYLLGRLHIARVILPETQKGINFLEQAIALDPNYALAFAELANAYRMQSLGGDLPAAEVLPKSKAAAIKALELDEALAEAHIALGHSAMWYDRNWEEAESQAKRALDLEPNNAAAMFLLENLYSFLGRHGEAIVMGNKVCELDPLSRVYKSIEAQTLLYAGHVEEALQQALKARDLDDNFWHVHLILARIYAQKGMYAEAIAEADKAALLSGDHSYDLAVKGYALARSGREIEARAIIDGLLKRARNARHNTNVALVYTGLRDKEKAFEYLERGFEDHELQHELRSAPAWHELRPDPRFTELMRKLRFE